MLQTVTLNAGRDHGVITAIPDPLTGTRVVVEINRTQRMIDRLLHAEAITPIQAAAGNALRDAWEAAGIAFGQAKAGGWRERVQNASSPPEIANERAWRIYNHGWASLSRDMRRLVSHVVLEDRLLITYDRAFRGMALPMLQTALERLAQAYGLKS